MEDVLKGVLGYDPKTHMISDMQIRTQNHLNPTYRKLDLPPLIIGKHRHQHVQSLYEDIHHFLNYSEWAPAQTEDEDNKVSGTTWLELFIMFDTGTHRRVGSSHVPSHAAKARANQRSAKRDSKAKANKSKPHHRDATRQATLTEELNLFKEITRAITKHDAKPEDAKLINMEKRQILRRLASLGVYGHQPAINAYVSSNKLTQDAIATAIIQQKVGANLKTTKAHNDFRDHRSPGEKMKVKIMRIAYSHAVRWKRNHREANNYTDDTTEQTTHHTKLHLPPY